MPGPGAGRGPSAVVRKKSSECKAKLRFFSHWTERFRSGKVMNLEELDSLKNSADDCAKAGVLVSGSVSL
jgi:hypothetical protein